MTNLNPLSRYEKQINTTLFPVLTATALGMLLVGCGQSVPTTKTDDVMSSASSSAEAMIKDSTSSISTQPSEGVMSSEAAMKQMYKDGMYTAAGVYRSPAGGESVTVSLTLKDDKVIDAKFSGDATNKKSIALQIAFGEGFKEQVIGKSIDEVSVGVVNGSSLTGIGFMDALGKIKTEAKA